MFRMKCKYFMLVFLAIVIAPSGAIIDISRFFPFGVDNGDQYLNPGDDTSSSEQTLSITFPFFNNSHSSLWVNVNGAISFLAPIETYTPSCEPVAQNFRMISPFWADVDTQAEQPSPASAISFRESTSTADIQKAKSELAYAFPDLSDIEITWVYIVTWYNVTYYGDDPNRMARDSFQTALASNGVNSFAIFYYNKIQWITGDASGGSGGFGGTPAQVGFDAGDGFNRFMLDVSCTNDVVNVNQMSNVNDAGMFAFRVDSANITTPPPATRPTRQSQPPITLAPSTVASTIPPQSTAPPLTTPEPTDPRSNAIGTACSMDTKQAWVDVIFAIDTSHVMNSHTLLELAGQIAGIMRGFNIGQNGDHTSRAGIITYSSNVVSRYNLTDVTSYSDFQKAIFKISKYSEPSDDGGNVNGALQLAQAILDCQKSNRRQAIILVAASYDDDGFQGAYQTANNIKNNGTSILTINFMENNTVLSSALKNISSLGYYYVKDQDDLTFRLPLALTEVNCFCPPNSQQFKYYNSQWQNYTVYADCLYGYDGDTYPDVAAFACAPGILVSLTSHEKFNFTENNIVPNDLKGKKKFLTGLHLSGNQWNWWGYNTTEYPLDMYPVFNQTPAATDLYGYMWNYQGFNWKLMTVDDNTPLPYVCQSQACDASFICDLTQP